jgi:hypothetical protein
MNRRDFLKSATSAVVAASLAGKIPLPGADAGVSLAEVFPDGIFYSNVGPSKIAAALDAQRATRILEEHYLSHLRSVMESDAVIFSRRNS